MPLQAPINYGIDIPDPNEALRKQLDFATGLASAQQGMQEAQQKNQLFALQYQQAQQAQARQQTLDASLAALATNPTPDAIARFTVTNPTLAEKMKPAFEMLSAQDQQAQLYLGKRMHAAMLQGMPDVAQKLALESAAANKNSGNIARAKQLEDLAVTIGQDPNHANAAVGSFLAGVQGADKYLADFGKYTDLGVDARSKEAAAKKAESDVTPEALAADLLKKQSEAKKEKSAADIADQMNSADLASKKATEANLRNEIKNRDATQTLAGKDFDLKKQEQEAKRADLSPEILKDVNADQEKARSEGEAAQKASNLAGLIRKGLSTSGGIASMSEFTKRLLGNQDTETELRQQYNQLLSEETLSRLKGLGRINQREIEMVREGFASATSHPERMARTLELMAEASRLTADSSQAKADWKTAMRGNLAAPADKAFTAGGRAVLPGDSFAKVIGLTPELSMKRARAWAIDQKLAGK